MRKDNAIILKECILELAKAILSKSNIKLIETETHPSIYHDEPELNKLKINIIHLKEPNNKIITKTFANIDEDDCYEYRHILIEVLKLIDEYVDIDLFIGDNIIKNNETIVCETRGSDIENNVVTENTNNIDTNTALYDRDFTYELLYKVNGKDNIHLTPSILKLHLYLEPEYEYLEDDETGEKSFIENKKTAKLDLIFDFDDETVSFVMNVIEYEVWDWDTEDITEHEKQLLNIQRHLDSKTPLGTYVKEKLLKMHPNNAYINILYNIPNLLNLLEKLTIIIKNN